MAITAESLSMDSKCCDARKRQGKTSPCKNSAVLGSWEKGDGKVVTSSKILGTWELQWVLE